MAKQKRGTSSFWGWILRGIAGLVILCTTLIIIGVLLFQSWVTAYAATVNSPDALMAIHAQGVTLLDRTGRVFFTFYAPNRRTTVPLSAISTNLQNAVIASEDRDFYHHPGFNWRAIAESFIANAQAGGITRGGSTITQQLVKITLLTPTQSYVRKFQELLLAADVEQHYSKQQILEMYLNSVYFGNGAYGAELASQTFFGKPAKDLDIAQAALLAGVLPSPSALSPLTGNVDAAKHRQHEVLQSMVDTGSITNDQATQAANEPLDFKSAPDVANLDTVAPHFALLVRQQLIDQYGEDVVSHSGFTVKTTLDLNEQTFAEQTVADQVKSLALHNVSNGAAVLEDAHSGEILAMVGSRDWNWPGFGAVNVATAERQPGSSFKPIVYSLALDKRLITPATTLHDAPIIYRDPWGNTYQPKDYDNRYRGNVTVRRALSNSLNIPAVEVMNKLSTGDVVNWAKNLGITTLQDPTHYGLSLVLGAAEVTPLDLTNVYATFADGGRYKDPVSILEITDKFGHKLDTKPQESHQAVSPQVTYLLTSILSDNAARKEEFGNSLTVNIPAAVKTGTTSDFKDAWTLGYTPYRAVGVWVGNNDGAPMDTVAGALGAAPIWKALIVHAQASAPPAGFTPPSNGLAHGSPCSGQANEWFLSGTEPSKACGSPTLPSQIQNQNQADQAAKNGNETSHH